LDPILDEDRCAYHAVAERWRVRLLSDGDADWQRVRARLTTRAERVEPSTSATALFRRDVQIYGIAE
jgi:hypothetical protein